MLGRISMLQAASECVQGSQSLRRFHSVHAWYDRSTNFLELEVNVPGTIGILRDGLTFWYYFRCSRPKNYQNSTNCFCFCFCCIGGGDEILRSVADARSAFHEYNRAHSMLIPSKAWSWEKGLHGAGQGLCVESMVNPGWRTLEVALIRVYLR